MRCGGCRYCTVRETKKGDFKLLDSRDLKPISVNTNWICAETGSLLQPTEIAPYFPFGKGVDKVEFTKEEVAKLKLLRPTGLRILGFKALSTLKPHYNLRPCNFLYPAEDVVKGSNAAFVALYRKCVEKGVYALARVSPRMNAVPRLAALIAQEEDAEAMTPPGFNVVWLPWADDIRHLELPAIPEDEIPRAAVEAAKTLAQRINIEGFSSDLFDNPVLQYHYATLQALALDEDGIAEEVPDTVVPPVEDFEAVGAQALVQPFLDAIYTDGYTEPTGPVPKKPAAKRKAPEPLDDGIDWQDAAVSNKIAKMTLDQIKGFCRSKGLALGGVSRSA